MYARNYAYNVVFRCVMESGETQEWNSTQFFSSSAVQILFSFYYYYYFFFPEDAFQVYCLFEILSLLLLPPPLLALSIRERDYTILLSGGTIEQSGKTKYTCTHGGIDEVCTCCVVAKRDRRDQSLIFLALVYRIKGRKIFGFIFMLPLIYIQKFEYRPSRDEREKNIRRWIIFLI